MLPFVMESLHEVHKMKGQWANKTLQSAHVLVAHFKRDEFGSNLM